MEIDSVFHPSHFKILISYPVVSTLDTDMRHTTCIEDAYIYITRESPGYE